MLTTQRPADMVLDTRTETEGSFGSGPRQPALRPGTAAEAGLSPDGLLRASEVARRCAAAGVHGAVVVAVARRGVVALHEAHHRPDELGETPVTTDTLFLLASLTKPITAVAVMILVEDGLVGLTRPVSEYLPEFRGAGKDDVFVHHLLTHTSGLEDPPDEGELMSTAPAAASLDPTQDPFIDTYLRASYGLPLHQRPGQVMTYCNLNYELLGEIVRRVSGTAFDEFCRHRIFDPLGMSRSHIGPDIDVRSESVRPLAHGHLSTDDEFFVRPSASGGGWSTAWDMATFAQLYLDGGTAAGGPLLSAHAVREMTRNQVAGIAASCVRDYHAEASWGFG